MKMNDNTIPRSSGSLTRYHLNSTIQRDAESLSKTYRMWNLQTQTIISKSSSESMLTSPIRQKDIDYPFHNLSAIAGGNGWRAGKHTDFIDLSLCDIKNWFYNVIVPNIQ